MNSNVKAAKVCKSMSVIKVLGTLRNYSILCISLHDLYFRSTGILFFDENSI